MQNIGNFKIRYVLFIIIIIIIIIIFIIIIIIIIIIIAEPMTIEQQCENGATLIPHPSECQLFYNCSLRYEYVPRNLEQHMQECPYPQLFNSRSLECDDFQNVDCAERTETVDGCKYNTVNS